ncbi:flagellar basal body rod protein FlgG [Ornithinibacillus halotolerans]|uniref:Flagellar hook protein FlgE n=1 Tax=Ornithinibacillus halotolerans TaxID=1274357 RepID=A0A916RMR3_9BACI|nr:flagellar basal body rod protein FlgG [Ornithinibacillus halotolerans]GGA63039.1 flagellar basal-body rod protein FlgG [Ornithinibacillus halotolerans]
MLRSMYAGISGMKNFQTKLDVIGNNIANVNTVGFKKGRITFQDMMSQMSASAQGATANRGGINPIQVGLGSQIGSIDNIHTQGFRQTTNNPLDLALEGDGMFVVSDGEREYYTRAGNFYLDEQGFIVNSQGYYLYGETESGDNRLQIPRDAIGFNIQTDGVVSYTDGHEVTEIGNIMLASISNPAGLEKVGSNLFINGPNAGVLEEDDVPTYVLPGTNGTGTIVTGALEMSNVDLSEEFTEMITAQRSFQANTRMITTSDEILQELVNLKR